MSMYTLGLLIIIALLVLFGVEHAHEEEEHAHEEEEHWMSVCGKIINNNQ